MNVNRDDLIQPEAVTLDTIPLKVMGEHRALIEHDLGLY